MDNQIKTILASINLKSASNTDETALPDVVQQMLSSPLLTPQDKSPYRLSVEGRTIVAAGTETTGHTLTSIAFHLLANPSWAEKLRVELLEAQKSSSDETQPLSYAQVQRLPYLSAVIQEGFRISSAVAGRHPRINPRSPMPYKHYSIPAGTPVSTTQKLTHDNPTIFPEPRQFKPERWLTPDDNERKRLEKYVIPFGRGSRSCLGVNLANMELYLVVAGIFGRADWDLVLFETGREDIEQEHDFFSPFPKADGKGLRVMVQ